MRNVRAADGTEVVSKRRRQDWNLLGLLLTDVNFLCLPYAENDLAETAALQRDGHASSAGNIQAQGAGP